MKRRQSYDFSFSDSLLAELTGVPQRALHFDVDAICGAYDRLRLIAERLDVVAPPPKLAGFTYTHVAALGARIEFTDFEPKPLPLVHTPAEIDKMEEPKDYLGAPLLQQRLKIADELRRRYPEAPGFIGHQFEGPVTSAVLLMGQEFLLLPYDDPERAHRLLEFCARSSLNYARAISAHFGKSITAVQEGFPDDFAGMFPPKVFADFVLPYWEQVYRGMEAGQRFLHSELLRVSHLPFLGQLHIDYFDPGVDQYLTPEILRNHCPCQFQCRITEWQVRDLTAKELQCLYRRLAKQEPYSVMFQLVRLEDEPKIRALLEVARELN